MSNNYDITNYLVEPDFAKWLKEQGFDGICDNSYSTITNVIENCGGLRNGYFSATQISVPTFQQAFDFLEEKFGLHVFVGANVGLSGYNASVIKSDKSNIFRVEGFIEKCEANIGACNAIKEYVENLK